MTDRYARRLDAHLATFASDRARAVFLDGEMEKWIGRFETFQREVGKGIYTGAAQAADFHISMADVARRRAEYARAAA
jgi:hypothetical protein